MADATPDHRRNRAVTDVYELGSVMKTFSAATVLKYGDNHSKDMISMMESVVEGVGGTGSKAEIPLYHVAGKTALIGASASLAISGAPYSDIIAGVRVGYSNGVPIAEPVAGIAMGLIKEGTKYAVLSDILGDEDHLGDMDFKVAGTRYGVTALQMDIKIKGISRDVLEHALEQARVGRLHILGIMNEVIKEHNEEVSDVAPQIHILNINPAKIKDVVGRGGSTVKGIAEKTGAQIDTNDTGEVKVFAKNKASLDMAVAMIEEVVAEVEEGQVYKESASLKVKELVEEEGDNSLSLRVYITGGGCSGFQYAFAFDNEAKEDDMVVQWYLMLLILFNYLVVKVVLLAVKESLCQFYQRLQLRLKDQKQFTGFILKVV
ncbi:hypothetical protein EGW08_023162 [Elysia chlorotica]|uniref:K Homology domain-containing protein n=1 Tax=Elysia chlorotica TaxID=188477 RepID=A0A3S1AQE8_ELYCH|nr:hypothetical protein EGW08_023162 [Elysia chlorotica]